MKTASNQAWRAVDRIFFRPHHQKIKNQGLSYSHSMWKLQPILSEKMRKIRFRKQKKKIAKVVKPHFAQWPVNVAQKKAIMEDKELFLFNFNPGLITHLAFEVFSRHVFDRTAKQCKTRVCEIFTYLRSQKMSHNQHVFAVLTSVFLVAFTPVMLWVSFFF